MTGKSKLLVVDDSEIDREILAEFFSDTYDVIQVDNGFDALITAVTEKDKLDVIILDVMMPTFNGFEVLQRMRKTPDLDHIPVILITGEGSMDNVRQGFQCGMADFIVKPFDARTIRQRVESAVERFNNEISKRVSHIGMASSSSYYDLLFDTLNELFEYRGFESPRHISCVCKYTEIMLKYIAKQYPEFGVNPQDISMIADAAAFHDIGKLALPDYLLRKDEDKMSEAELKMMQDHTTLGCTLLKCFQNDKNVEFIDNCCNIAMFHHERSTGQGYPRGLKHADIPIAA